MQLSSSSLAVLFILGLAHTSVAARLFKAKRSTRSVRVATLVAHAPSSWGGSCGRAGNWSLERAQCNLDVYEEAAKTAQRQGAELLLLPEYGLSGLILWGAKTLHADAIPSVEDRPCGWHLYQKSSQWTQVSRLSCIARRYGVALASNIITKDGSGGPYITEVVYNSTGHVVAVYHKHDLFRAETWAKSGPFKPTVFKLFGQTWGLAICFEGFAPWAPGIGGHGSWKHFDSLRDQGAENLLWSIGTAPVYNLITGAQKIAKRYQMNVFANMIKLKANAKGETTTLVDRRGKNFAKSSIPLDAKAFAILGYRGAPHIDVATV